MTLATEPTTALETPAAVAPDGAWRNGTNKDAQLLAGLKRMQSRQRQGQCFSVCEIARECGVEHSTITRTERRALEKVKQRLHGLSNGVLGEIFSGAQINEIFKGGVRDVYKAAGKRMRGPKLSDKMLRVMKVEKERERERIYRGAGTDRAVA